jgi:hypothetical protein
MASSIPVAALPYTTNGVFWHETPRQVVRDGAAAVAEAHVLAAARSSGLVAATLATNLKGDGGATGFGGRTAGRATTPR